MNSRGKFLTAVMFGALLFSLVAPAQSKTLTTTATPASLSFSAQVGGAVPALQGVTIRSTNTLSMQFAISTDEPWITLNAKTGSTLKAVEVTVNQASLPAGAYSGHVFITPSGAQHSPVTIPLTLKVSPKPGLALVTAPSISTQPVSQTITAGKTATFSVVASGTAPFTYQWNNNGAAISGATSAGYTTPVTTTANSGSQFSVTVGNKAGSVSSSSATLTINASVVAPSISTQPVSQTITAGKTATFSVVASGTAPFTYQWNNNGAAISGATSAGYTTPVTTTTNSGSQFSVTVGNKAGSVTSSSATLTVSALVVAPAITGQPTSQTVNAGQSATFSAAASGSATLAYQWTKNGAAVSGATSATYTTPVTAAADNGSQFAVTVSNSGGSATSNSATLTVTTTTYTISASPASLSFTATLKGLASAQQSVTIDDTTPGPLPFTMSADSSWITLPAASGTTKAVEAFTVNPGTLAAGTYTGHILVSASGVANSPLSVPVTMVVSAAAQAPSLTISQSSLSFANVNTGSNSVLGVNLTNSGTANITVSNVSISGPGFTASGVSSGLILTPNQMATMNVTFAPAATGSVTGSVTVTSNAANSSASIALSGTGMAAAGHSAALAWTADGSSVNGYNVYRSTISGGPYTMVNPTLNTTTAFTDTTVQAGQYYYVVTAVNSSNVESGYSSQVPALVP